MTTIIATQDGMWSDSAMATGNIQTQVRKIFRVRGHLIGLAGHSHIGSEFLAKFRKSNSPARKREENDEFQAVVLFKDGRLLHFDESFGWDEISEPYIAIGSGAPFAITAMDCGATPEQAIEIAAKRDGDTRLPVQFESLDERSPEDAH
jgi:ATP-dependent protease HslVU (ClpYQ) peptidase subunit